MIHHILLYKFKDGSDRIDEHLKVISRFENNTEGLTALKYGRIIDPESLKEYTHGFVMSFNNSESLDKYNHSVAHLNLVNMFKNDIERKKVVDFEDVEY